MRKQMFIVASAILLLGVPAAEAKPTAAKKCSIKRVDPQGFYAPEAGPVPVGNVRVRGISCATARRGMAGWFEAYQERTQAGRKASVTYIEVAGRSFRCAFRQTPYRTDKNGNSINPYAVVKCRARGGVRLYSEGYA